MNSSLDKIRARARLLLAANRWRELMQFLDRDLPTLISEVEQLQRELAEAKSHNGRHRLPVPDVPQNRAVGHGEAQLLSSRQFAQAIGISEWTVRKRICERTINIVRLGRLVRIPRTEIQRLVDEGAIPVRPSWRQPPSP